MKGFFIEVLSINSLSLSVFDVVGIEEFVKTLFKKIIMGSHYAKRVLSIFRLHG